MSEKIVTQEIPLNIKLRMSCEVVTEHLLPLIRRELAQELVNERGVRQLQAARILGVTQPAVSNYLHSKPKIRGELEGSARDVERMVKDFSEDLLRGRLTQIEALRRICSLCIQMRNRGVICSIHGEEIPALQPGRCSLCLMDLAKVRERSLEEYEAVENVRLALQLIEGTREMALLIPEIGMNIAYAKPKATNVEEVVAVPGRIRPIGGRPLAAGSPEFGASSHVARAVLTMMRFEPSLRSAISLKFDWEAVEICKDFGLIVSSFDRAEEPAEVKMVDGRTIPWGVEQAVKRSEETPSVIYDLGDIGKEPMIFLYGPTALDVAQLAARVAKEYAGRRSSSSKKGRR
jgi:predicted fused transcriptional regulator/phosphomethylpyrimidine kinase/predicted transcriptional regulator